MQNHIRLNLFCMNKSSLGLPPEVMDDTVRTIDIDEASATIAGSLSPCLSLSSKKDAHPQSRTTSTRVLLKLQADQTGKGTYSLLAEGVAFQSLWNDAL